MNSDWKEERCLRVNAVLGSRKLLEAILKARGIKVKRRRVRKYLPRHYGYTENETVLRFQRIVADHFGLREDLLYTAGRRRCYSRPRQVAMYFAHTLGGVSLPMIGRHFNRDHTTVLHACRAVPANDALAADVAALRERLAG